MHVQAFATRVNATLVLQMCDDAAAQGAIRRLWRGQMDKSARGSAAGGCARDDSDAVCCTNDPLEVWALARAWLAARRPRAPRVVLVFEPWLRLFDRQWGETALLLFWHYRTVLHDHVFAQGWSSHSTVGGGGGGGYVVRTRDDNNSNEGGGGDGDDDDDGCSSSSCGLSKRQGPPPPFKALLTTTLPVAVVPHMCTVAAAPVSCVALWRRLQPIGPSVEGVDVRNMNQLHPFSAHVHGDNDDPPRDDSGGGGGDDDDDDNDDVHHDKSSRSDHQARPTARCGPPPDVLGPLSVQLWMYEHSIVGDTVPVLALPLHQPFAPVAEQRVMIRAWVRR